MLKNKIVFFGRILDIVLVPRCVSHSPKVGWCVFGQENWLVCFWSKKLVSHLRVPGRWARVRGQWVRGRWVRMGLRRPHIKTECTRALVSRIFFAACRFVFAASLRRVASRLAFACLLTAASVTGSWGDASGASISMPIFKLVFSAIYSCIYHCIVFSQKILDIRSLPCVGIVENFSTFCAPRGSGQSTERDYF